MSDNLPPSKFGAGHTYGGDPTPARPAPAYGQPVHKTAANAAFSPPPSYAPQPVPPPPGYPAPSGQMAPPVAGYAMPGYGMPAGSSGATAIIAGILALLMGLFRVWQTYGLFVGVASFSRYVSDLPGMGRIQAWITIEAFASAAAALTLVLGAILLLARKSAGRRFTAIGCVIVIVDAVVTLAVLNGWFDDAFGFLGSEIGSFGLHAGNLLLLVAITLGVPVLTLILALCGPSRRWCEAPRSAYVAPTTY